jgi:hypothetical protein
MSTSSKYSSNKLKQVINNNTQHFVSRSFISASFEYDRKVYEYHLYWYNANKGKFEDMHCYKSMSFKLLNNKEIKYFKSIIDEYDKVVDNRYGCIWENKELGFNKAAVQIFQLTLF